MAIPWIHNTVALNQLFRQACILASVIDTFLFQTAKKQESFNAATTLCTTSLSSVVGVIWSIPVGQVCELCMHLIIDLFHTIHSLLPLPLSSLLLFFMCHSTDVIFFFRQLPAGSWTTTTCMKWWLKLHKRKLCKLAVVAALEILELLQVLIYKVSVGGCSVCLFVVLRLGVMLVIFTFCFSFFEVTVRSLLHQHSSHNSATTHHSHSDGEGSSVDGTNNSKKQKTQDNRLTSDKRSYSQ